VASVLATGEQSYWEASHRALYLAYRGCITLILNRTLINVMKGQIQEEIVSSTF